jgi:hypothetical protein
VRDASSVVLTKVSGGQGPLPSLPPESADLVLRILDTLRARFSTPTKPPQHEVMQFALRRLFEPQMRRRAFETARRPTGQEQEY